MTKRDTQSPPSREMTPGELAADKAHVAAHARALDEERERNEIIKQRIKADDINPAIAPDQLEVTPGLHPPRAADVFRTNAEQHGGATGPAAAAVDTETPATSRKH